MDQLERYIRNSLTTLPADLAETVGLHLAAAGAFIDSDPQRALSHAMAAARKAGRVAVVREATGVAAYSAGDYGRAITELKAAGRISGSTAYLPMIADCERGLGRPDRALEIASSVEATTLDAAGKVEMLIVAAGARRDKGQIGAAILTLQVPALRARTTEPWLARLRYAYADALAADGRTAEAKNWFAQAAQADPEWVTDAAERLEEMNGLTFAQDEVGDDDGEQ